MKEELATIYKLIETPENFQNWLERYQPLDPDIYEGESLICTYLRSQGLPNPYRYSDRITFEQLDGISDIFCNFYRYWRFTYTRANPVPDMPFWLWRFIEEQHGYLTIAETLDLVKLIAQEPLPTFENIILRKIRTPTAFRSWLSAQEPTAIVGNGNDTETCPLANWLAYLGMPSPMVEYTQISYLLQTPLGLRHIIYAVHRQAEDDQRLLSPIYALKFGDWISLFQRQLEDEKITAYDAIAILDGL